MNSKLTLEVGDGSSGGSVEIDSSIIIFKIICYYTCNRTSFVGVDIPSDRNGTSGVVTLPVIGQHFLIIFNIRYSHHISFRVGPLYGTSDVPNYHTHKDIDTPFGIATVNVATLDGVDGSLSSTHSHHLHVSGGYSIQENLQP